MKNILVLILLANLASCSQAKNLNSKVVSPEDNLEVSTEVNSEANSQISSKNTIFWVNSSKASCTGAAPMECLQVQKNATIDDNQWELFYSDIEGFNYEEGFLYKIEVKEEHLPENEVPADASSIKYSLIKVISKTGEKSYPIQNTWALESIQGKTIVLGKSIRPEVRFNLKAMRLTGTDGCNQIFCKINNVTASTIELGPIAGTKMACQDMSIANDLHKQLKNVSAYKIDVLSLLLLDNNGIEILSFARTN